MNIGDKFNVCINGIIEERIATAEDVAEEDAMLEELEAAKRNSIPYLQQQIAMLEDVIKLLVSGATE